MTEQDPGEVESAGTEASLTMYDRRDRGDRLTITQDLVEARSHGRNGDNLACVKKETLMTTEGEKGDDSLR